MRFTHAKVVGLLTLVLAVAMALGGCGKDDANSKTKTSQTPTSVTKPVAPLIPQVQLTDWCKEHTVPESICTRCNASLIAEFKKKGDWCAQHNLPDSQCFDCHPEHKTKFEAMAPASAL